MTDFPATDYFLRLSACDWRRLHEAPAEAASWDLGDEAVEALNRDGFRLMAVESRHGGFSYVGVKVTGRSCRMVASSCSGVSCRVRFDIGTEDEETVSAAVCKEGGRWFHWGAARLELGPSTIYFG